MPSVVAQIEPALDADKPLGHTIGGGLLLDIGGCQMTEMPNDRRRAALDIGQSAFDRAERSLNVREVGANRAKRCKDQVLWTVDHVLFVPSRWRHRKQPEDAIVSVVHV